MIPRAGSPGIPTIMAQVPGIPSWHLPPGVSDQPGIPGKGAPGIPGRQGVPGMQSIPGAPGARLGKRAERELSLAAPLLNPRRSY